MKFVVVSTFYKAGGAELQAIFERDILLKNGIDAIYLTFDPMLKSGESRESHHLNLIGNYSQIYVRIERAIIDPLIIRKIYRFIKTERPDVVHFHNVSFAFNSIALGFAKCRILQTMHDYSCICDKNLKCIRNDFSLCKDFRKSQCLMYCFNKRMIDRLILNYKYFVRTISNSIRKRIIRNIISPSDHLMKCLNNYGFYASTINNPINETYFRDFRKRLDTINKRKIVFLGSVSLRKGIIQLLNALSDYEWNNIELEIIGNIDFDIDKHSFFELVTKSKANYLGHLEYRDVLKRLEEAYAIIIPSLWIENYPNVAIEGMMTECIVFGSNRGGMTEMVADKSLLFDVLNPNDIRRCISMISDMDEFTRLSYIRIQKEYCSTHNTEELYFSKLMSFINAI